MKARILHKNGDQSDFEIEGSPIPEYVLIPTDGGVRIEWDEKLKRGVGHAGPINSPPSFPAIRCYYAGFVDGVAVYVE